MNADPQAAASSAASCAARAAAHVASTFLASLQLQNDIHCKNTYAIILYNLQHTRSAWMHAPLAWRFSILQEYDLHWRTLSLPLYLHTWAATAA